MGAPLILEDADYFHRNGFRFRAREHGPGVALHPWFQIGFFENFDFPRFGADGRGLLSRHDIRARKRHNECGKLLHGTFLTTLAL